MNIIKPVHVFATWKVKEGQVDTVLALLTAVRLDTAKEPGNLFYQIHQVIADKNTIILFEGYKDEAAVAAHRNSAHFQNEVIGKIIPLLENREVVLTRPI